MNIKLTDKQWEQVDNLVDKLGCSIDEAIEALQQDKEIDQGKKLNELPKELQPGAKKARQAERKPRAPVKRERKADEDKRTLIKAIQGALNNCDSIEITNIEREINFTFNNRKFKIILSAPRN